MKLHFLHKNLVSNVKFSVYQEKKFLKLWHYHPELELVYIARGEGTLYAGDFIGNYQKDDVFLLGKNVPHMFNSRIADHADGYSKAYVFHINDDFFADNFLHLHEFIFLKDLMRISKRGIMFREPGNRKLLQILDSLPIHAPADHLIKVFTILFHLSQYSNSTVLGSVKWLNRFQIADNRVNNVIEHVMLHFKENISLEKAAEIAAMNKTAFCRYFKKSTGKSFTEFLNEVRINYSCKLLVETAPVKSITEVAYQSGFNSLSYYHRTFKKLMNLSPSSYQLLEHTSGKNQDRQPV